MPADPPAAPDPASKAPLRVHGTALARPDGCAVLIRGPSGAGKSDLALRALELAGPGLGLEPLHLVADDQVLIARYGDRLLVSAPEPLFGLLEVRGVGIVPVPARRDGVLRLLVDLAPADQIERLPAPRPPELVLGCPVPIVEVAPFEPSAPLKLALALNQAAGAPAAAKD